MQPIATRLSAFLIAAPLFLSACSPAVVEGIQYASQEYRGVEIQQHEFADQQWRVFDNEDQSKLMITPSLAAAAAAGTADVATLGATRKTWTTAEEFEPAASDFLRTRGCTITGGRLVLRTQFEFSYSC